jgi:heptosyltransferase-2
MHLPSTGCLSPNASILVRGVNWLGDAVMTTPALLRLREAYPQAFITLLTPLKLAELWTHHPAIDAVLSFDAKEGPFVLARRLREPRFQAGLVFPNSFRSAFELWLARIPRRIGYAGQLRTPLLTDAVATRPELVQMHKRSKQEIEALIRAQPGAELNVGVTAGSIGRGAMRAEMSQNPSAAHHLYQYLHLVSSCGAKAAALAPQLFVKEDESQALLDRWGLAVQPGQFLLGLVPGAEYGPAKRWPAERFIEAACTVQERCHCRWLIFGGSADVKLAAGVTAGIEGRLRAAISRDGNAPINLAGKTSLRELCAGLNACRVVLTNDTGPMHVAAAVGTPVVALFGSTAAGLTAPGLPGEPRHRLFQSGVPCSPCFLPECPIDFRCMRQIQVGQVVDAVIRTIS